MTEKYQRVSVGGFLFKDDKVLVVKRSSNEKFFPNHFELPGGKVNFGEHPDDSIKREFLEETNLKILPLKIYTSYIYFSDNNNRQTIELVYIVKLNDDIKNIKLSKEHTEFKWTSLKDIDNLNISEQMRANIKLGFKSVYDI